MPTATPAARVRMHLSIVLAMGLPFAAVQIVLLPLITERGVVGSVVDGIINGLVFGVIMSALLGTAQWRAAVGAHRRRLTTDPEAPFDLRIRASGTVAITAGRDEVLRAAAGAAAALGYAKIKAVDEAEGTITMTVGPSWQSWGERVIVTAGAGAVTTTSRPLVPLTTVDYGRNIANVDKVAAWARAL